MRQLLIELLEPMVIIMIGFISSIITIPQIIKFVKKYNLLDQPNWRSAHKEPTPSFGGISFTVGLLFALAIIPFDLQTTTLIVCCLVFSILGAVDDVKDLKSTFKLFIQLGVSSTLFFSGFKLHNLNGIFGIYELPIWVSFILTIIIITAIINAFNLIDGIDGLAGGVDLIGTITFAFIFFLKGDFSFFMISLVLIGSLIGFLGYNFNPAKIFMGDTGSLVLGLIMAIFFIRVFNYQSTPLSITSIAIILVPCLDMLRLFIARIKNGVSPFKADKNHYHHLLLKSGDSHKKATLTCYAITISLLLISLLIGNNIEITPGFLTLITIGSIIYIIAELKGLFKNNKTKKAIEVQLKKATKNNHLLNQFI